MYKYYRLFRLKFKQISFEYKYIIIIFSIWMFIIIVISSISLAKALRTNHKSKTEIYDQPKVIGKAVTIKDPPIETKTEVHFINNNNTVYSATICGMDEGDEVTIYEGKTPIIKTKNTNNSVENIKFDFPQGLKLCDEVYVGCNYDD